MGHISNIYTYGNMILNPYLRFTESYQQDMAMLHLMKHNTKVKTKALLHLALEYTAQYNAHTSLLLL